MNPFSKVGSATLAALLSLITLVAMAWALRLRTDPGIEAMIPASGRDADLLREVASRFGAGDVVVVALHSDSLFSGASLAAVDDLTRGASGIPHVARVVSPTNLRDLDYDELGPVETIPYGKVAAGLIPPEQLGRTLAAHPLFGGLLVSVDARTAALLVEIEHPGEGEDYGAEVVRGLRELVGRASLGWPSGMSAYIAGLPVENADVAAYIKRDQGIFAPLILLALAVAMFALYRHAVAVIVPLCVVGGSLIWTLGAYAMAGRSLNPVTSLLTPVVLVVSLEGAVHLMNHHFAARAAGLDRLRALRHAVRRSSAPCFNAALTTAIGFASLLLLPIQGLRDLGLFSAIGVMISYLLTMTLAPLLLWWLPDVPPRIMRSFRPGRIEAALRGVAAAVCRRPAAWTMLSILVVGACALGLARLRVETDLIGSLRRGSPLAVATEFIDRNLTGVNALEILVRGVGPEDGAGLLRVEEMSRKVRAMPGVRKVTGLSDLYARANRAFHASDAYATLPRGEDAAADLADAHDLLSRNAPADFARFVSAEPGRGEPVLRVEARVTAMGTAASQDLFRRVRAAASEAGIEKTDLTGNFVVLSNMSTNLVYNQIGGLVPALLLILVAMAIQFRSVKLGLLCVIPNGAPVLMVYGVMGWAGIALSVPTAMIASIAVGMTVDNTIHLLARFRQDFRESGDYMKSLDVMLNTSGRAVVFSTVTLAVGFWVGAFSAFLPSVHFAVLMGMTMLLGLATEAVLLPLTLILFKPLGRALGRALVVLAVAGACLSHPSAAESADVKLLDQFGKADAPGLHRGRIVVLFYGQPAGLRKMKAWELKLKGRTKVSYDVMRAVDARSVKGKKTPEEVNERLRSGVPDDVDILIDWDGALAAAYALTPAEVAVVVIDPLGRKCAGVSGPVRDDSLELMANTITHLAKKGS